MTLSEEITCEEVSADLKDSVLEVVLPKKNPAPRKKIQINNEAPKTFLFFRFPVNILKY